MKNLLLLIIAALCLCSCDYDANFYSDNINEVKKAIRIKPQDIDKITQFQTTPLIYAAQKNNVKVVKTLINNGANINKKDDKGSALSHVIELNVFKLEPTVENNNKKRIEIAAFLIEHGADVNEGHINRLNFLNKGVLYRALYDCNPEIANILIDKGSEVGINELWAAVMSMNPELQKYPVYNKFCNLEYYKHILSKMLTRMNPIIINNNDTDDRDTVLMSATKNNSLEVVEIILNQSQCKWSAFTKYYIDINKQNINGETALMHAVNTGNIDMVKQIMRCDPKLDIKNNKGKTALIIAKEKGYKNIVKYLTNP